MTKIIKSALFFILVLFNLSVRAQTNKYLYVGIRDGIMPELQQYLNERAQDRILAHVLPIKKGYTVASIGAGKGWEESIYNEKTEVVHYYIQDLKTYRKIGKYLTINVKILNFGHTKNSFTIIKGTPTNSNLPDKSCDIIIISNAFHEFSEPDSMLNDLKSKLKANGKLIIIENFSNEIEFHYDGCQKTGYTYKKINDIFQRHDLYITKTSAPKNSFYNALTFELEKPKMDTTKSELELLNNLYSFSWINNERNFSQIEKLLIQKKSMIDFLYPDFPNSLSEAAFYFTKKNEFKTSQTILNLKKEFYSINKFDTHLLGLAYFMNGDFKNASNTFDGYIQKFGTPHRNSNVKYYQLKSQKYYAQNRAFSKQDMIAKEEKHYKTKIIFRAATGILGLLGLLALLL